MSYHRYKYIKEHFNIVYRGIKLNQVLAINIWQWCSDVGIESINIKKTWNKSLDFSFLPDYKGNRIMFFDIDRKDHQKTFFDIAEKVKGEFEPIDVSGKIHEKKCFSIRNLFVALYYVFFSKLAFVFSFRQKLKLGSYLCFILNTIDELYKKSPKPVERFVAYSSIHPWENLMCQYYKIKGAKTFGLSHGLFPLFTKNIPIDCLNYENLDVDCCLVWGRMSKEVYHEYGIETDKLRIAGYPKKIKVSAISRNNSFKKCLVLLSRPQFDNANCSLLEILKEYSNEFAFELKLHPMCDYERYNTIAQKNGFTILDKVVQLTDCMDNEMYDFAIAVNTSSYYEIMAAGIPCMRYEHGDDFDLMYGDENDRISSSKDFIYAIEWMRKKKEDNEYDSIIHGILEYSLGLGIDRYKEVLLS